jgi:hypothetical protein
MVVYLEMEMSDNFQKTNLLRRWTFLGTNEDYEPERKFITDCLANIDKNGNVLVGFY